VVMFLQKKQKNFLQIKKLELFLWGSKYSEWSRPIDILT
jgi:hypothetical protein